MRIEMTRQELADAIMSMTTNEIIDFFVEHGVDLVAFEPPLRGIYRREQGSDLIRLNEWDEWVKIDYTGNGDSEIVWACMSESDWWVMVLDEDHKPFWGGDRVRFNEKGERVE